MVSPAPVSACADAGTPGGVAPGERIDALDFVRGVAVLGIVIANIIALGQPMAASIWPGAFLTNPGDYADQLWGAQLVLVDGKFRGLFSLLFGAGLALFLARAEKRGQGHLLLARRLGILALFGFAHWALLWRGDILLTYAVAGLLVLGRVGKPWQGQVVLGLLLYALAAAASYASSVPVAATAQGQFPPGSTMARAQAALAGVRADDLADTRIETALKVAGDQGGMIRHVVSTHLAALPGDTLLAVMEAAPLMLIGMGLLGMGLFDGRVPRRRQAVAGLLLWLSGTSLSLLIAVWAIRGGLTYWDTFAAFNGLMAMPHFLSTLGLVAMLALIGQRRSGSIAMLIGDAGRCAFTNYIGTSALALVVFSGWGLGMFGKLGRAELYGVAALFWAVMLAWPQVWLARFRHGPLEWLWRCLTYGKRLPLRR